MFSSLRASSPLLKVPVHGWNICKLKTWFLLITVTSHKARSNVIPHTQQSFISQVKILIWGRALISVKPPTCSGTVLTVWNYTVCTCCYINVFPFYFPFPRPVLKHQDSSFLFINLGKQLPYCQQADATSRDVILRLIIRTCTFSAGAQPLRPRGFLKTKLQGLFLRQPRNDWQTAPMTSWAAWILSAP